MSYTNTDTLLRDLAQIRDTLLDLEPEVKQLQDRRKRMILNAISLGVPELKICKAAGVTRGWIWIVKGKKKNTGDGTNKRAPGNWKAPGPKRRRRASG